MIATFTSKDLRRIGWSLAFLAICSLLGAAVVVAAKQALRSAQAAAKQAEAERKDIRGKLARAREEEQEIRTKIARYQEMLARGYVTQEQRLNWVERIAQIKAARKLIDIEYELAPQAPVQSVILPEGAVGGGYEFMASTMKLRMQLLHEDDLLGFLSDLRQSVEALLVVRACDVERIARAAGGERATQAQLNAECGIDFITLREKK
jgi:hypothetical protein